MNPDDFNELIAHIRDGENVFQVLNEDGDDLDEAATRAVYERYLTEQ